MKKKNFYFVIGLIMLGLVVFPIAEKINAQEENGTKEENDSLLVPTKFVSLDLIQKEGSGTDYGERYEMARQKIYLVQGQNLVITLNKEPLCHPDGVRDTSYMVIRGMQIDSWGGWDSLKNWAENHVPLEWQYSKFYESSNVYYYQATTSGSGIVTLSFTSYTKPPYYALLRVIMKRQ